MPRYTKRLPSARLTDCRFRRLGNGDGHFGAEHSAAIATLLERFGQDGDGSSERSPKGDAASNPYRDRSVESEHLVVDADVDLGGPRYLKVDRLASKFRDDLGSLDALISRNREPIKASMKNIILKPNHAVRDEVAASLIPQIPSVRRGAGLGRVLDRH